MSDEAAQELRAGQGHFALFITVGVVFPSERDVFAVYRKQSMIADRYPMRIAAEVPKHLLSIAEGRLGISDPLFIRKLI